MFDLNDLSLITLINNKSININNIKYVNNLEYIHFNINEQKKLCFFSHFVKINDTKYYVNYFVNEHIISIKQNNNSEDIINFNNIICNRNYTKKYFDKAIIFYINTLSIGHEFATIMYNIYLYKQHNLNDYDIIITDVVKELGKFLISVLYLFFSKDKIHFVSNNDYIFIKNTVVWYPPSSKDSNSINLLLNTLENYKITNLEHSKNICLIKYDNISNIKINSPLRALSIDYIDFFKKNNFNIILPSDHDIISLYNLIQNAENIILSWGANSWINSIFTNNKTNVMILCNIYYKNEYTFFKNIENIKNTQWTPSLYNKLIMVYDLNIFDNNTHELLTLKLNDLTNNI